jgi:hypothetical protein
MIPILAPPGWGSGITASDPNFSSVVNLSHFDGTNGSTTFLDSSSHATNLNQVSSGALSTGQAKFGASSLTGVIGNTGAALYGIGTSDFTVEYWVYTTSTAGAQNVTYWDDSPGNNGIAIKVGGNMRFWLGGVSHDGSTAVTTNTWHFIAYSRTGSSGILYLDGVSQVSLTDSVNHTSNTLYLGGFSGLTSGLVGNIDDFRFTIGVGRYPSSCAVPTSPFPNH